MVFSKLEFDSISHVGVYRTSTPVSPLYLCEREPIYGVFKPEFDSISHVGVSRTSTPVSPLFLREREPIWVVFKT